MTMIDIQYIGHAVDVAIKEREARPVNLGERDKASARKASMRTVAGFSVHDEEEERRQLDAMIAKRRAGLEDFIAHRTGQRGALAAFGIVPMAILPTEAWKRICDKTELFRLSPDKQGKVGIARNCWENYKAPMRKYWNDPLEGIEGLRDKWKALLKAFWPDYVAEAVRYDRMLLQYNPQQVTILLPEPPAEVAQLLLRASKAGIDLKVAAVAEAIGIKEDLKALRDGHAKHYADEEARIQRLLADPIIYTEYGSATAILAQFGVFPVEKEVVDMVVQSDDLIPEKVDPISPQAYGAIGAMDQVWLLAQAVDTVRRQATDQYQQSLRMAEYQERIQALRNSGG